LIDWAGGSFSFLLRDGILMKALILKNRFTLLVTCLLAYVLVLVVEGFVTGRTPDLLHFDNSLFELNLLELQELSGTFD
jgi:hypothetical protein